MDPVVRSCISVDDGFYVERVQSYSYLRRSRSYGGKFHTLLASLRDGGGQGGFGFPHVGPGWSSGRATFRSSSRHPVPLSSSGAAEARDQCSNWFRP